MTPAVLVFVASLAALCFLVFTGHWIFGIAVLLIAGVMASAMIAGGGK